MDRTIHKQEFLLTSGHCDPDNRAALRFFADCFQDAARKHAHSLDLGVEQLGEQNRFWALTRILCELEERPVQGARVIVETWPKGSQGLFALRDFTMNDPKGIVIARATSSWVVVDSRTRRILHPPREREELYARQGVHALAKQPPKIDAPKISPETHTRRLFYSDTDLIRHVNNARYLDFMIDVHPIDYLDQHQPKGYAINFLSECHAGETLKLDLYREEGRSTVISSKGEKNAFTGRIWWQSREMRDE